MQKPTIGRIVIYRTDGRNGLVYDLPAIITCTQETHPGDYPDGKKNPLPVPEEGCVHLTVFTPGGFGTSVLPKDGTNYEVPLTDKADQFKDATAMWPGSGTYVEWNVPEALVSDDFPDIAARTWRWPVIR